MRIHTPITLVAVLMLGLVSTGHAGGEVAVSAPDANADVLAPPTAKPKPARWRIMTMEDATSTSRCIGDPRTPLCAVETLMACFIRRQVRLCTISEGLPESEAGQFHLSPLGPSYRTEYRVLRFRIIGNNDQLLNLNVEWLKPGDVDMFIFVRSCLMPRSSCIGEPVQRYNYVVRRDGNGWHITGYAAQDAPD